MAQFQVPVIIHYSGSLPVEAESFDEAVKKVRSQGIVHQASFFPEAYDKGKEAFLAETVTDQKFAHGEVDRSAVREPIEYGGRSIDLGEDDDEDLD